MKKFLEGVVICLLLLISTVRAYGANPTPTVVPISDPAVSSCPGEDQPPINPAVLPLGRGNYPFPQERPTSYSQPVNSQTSQLNLNQCLNLPAACLSSNTLQFIYQESSCPVTNGYIQDSDGCHLDVSVSGVSVLVPALVSGDYVVADTQNCWKPQAIKVDQGCTIGGGLSCQDGSGSSLSTDCSGSSVKITIPSAPPVANRDLLNGLPVVGNTCAREVSTPIQFPADFCVSGGNSGSLQIQPKSIKVPGAYDTGQYLSGILDTEHLSSTEINTIQDKVMGLPFNVMGLKRGISAAWEYTGPIARLAPQLEQDRLKHEFLGYLCQVSEDNSQGRLIDKPGRGRLNSRYADFKVSAPLMGSQLPGDFLLGKCLSFTPLGIDPNTWKDICKSVVDNKFSGNMAVLSACDIYQYKGWPNITIPFINISLGFIPVGDVYAKKMVSQCKDTDGKAVAGPCDKKPMYIPNFIEQAFWSRVPLFANEEGKGEIEFQVCNSSQTVKLPLAVPQVMRLASASAYLQQMLLSGADNQKNKEAMKFVPAPMPSDCVGCVEAQNGPADTEAFVDYGKDYNDADRGAVSYQGGGAAAQSDKDTITVRSNIPFLLNIWYQTAGGPFGIFNIFRGYRPGDKAVTGIFQPAGKPFAGDSNFLDTPGSGLVEYSGAGIKDDIWKLLYSKIAGVWNAKNWIMQSVAPY
ncbi:MAG: hypothetical protein UW73_C0009G0045 [Microgenomates group bacterium GW2011_GWB1_44_8]|nr:MAG: hypothetical protein UW73_C0009G0045 [Microgenomates group bacterium GW2011_GWB1_44_8]